MERIKLKELNMHTRVEVISFLKQLWNNEPTNCPLCQHRLEILHKKAKKSLDDWVCPNCSKIYKTIYLLDELNDQIPK